MEQIVLNLNLKYVIAGLTAEQKGLLLEALFEGAEKIAREGGESGLETGGESAARASGESAADMPLPAVLQNQPEAGNAYRFILLQQYEYEAKRRRMRQLGARGAARRKGNAAAKMADLFAAEAESSARSGGSAGAATMVIGCGSERSAVGADVNGLPGAGGSAGAGASLIEAVAGAAVAENNGAETCRATGGTAVVTGVGAAVGADAGAAVGAGGSSGVQTGGSSGVQAALTLKRKEAKENILNKNNILFLGLTEKKKEPAAGLELAADDGAAKATGLGLAADDGTARVPDKGGYGAAGASGVPDGSGGGSCKVSGASAGLSDKGGYGAAGASGVPDGSGGGLCGTVGSGGGLCGATGLGLAADDGTARVPDKGGYGAAGASGVSVPGGSGGGLCGATGLGLAADDRTAGLSDKGGYGAAGAAGASVPGGSGGGLCGTVGSGGGLCGATGSGGDNPGGRLTFFSGRKRRGAHASPVLSQPAFQPPSVAEVQAFVAAENLQLDAGTFVDFYDSHGWCVGKTAIKNWKATARLWHRRAVAEAATRGGKKTEDDDGYWAELENKISRL